MTTLHLFCGKIASGKSTLASNIARDHNAVLISEDHWLSRLYVGEIKNVSDYVKRSAQLQSAMGLHVEHLLQAGVSVALDFPANTIPNRMWMRHIFERAGVYHQLHYLDMPDEICKSRLCQRNAEGMHEFAVSDTDFELMTRHFVTPKVEERFNLVKHGAVHLDDRS